MAVPATMCIEGGGHHDPGMAAQVKENLRSWRARMRLKKAIIATVATTK